MGHDWIGDVPDELLRDLCDHSYSLVLGKLTKAKPGVFCHLVASL